MSRSPELLGAIARGYCTKENENKVLDPDLCVAICDEIEKLQNIKDTEEYKDMYRAIVCLSLEVDKSIVNDIEQKFNKLIAKINETSSVL